MSDEVYVQDLEDAVGSVTDETRFLALQQTQEGGLRRLKNITGAFVRSWIAALTQTITGVWTFSTGIIVGYLSLISGRKFAEPSGSDQTISASGWYQVAYLKTTSIEQGRARFTFSGYGPSRVGSLSCLVSAVATANTEKKLVCKLEPGCEYYTDANPFKSVRLAYADDNEAGVFLEVYVDVSTTVAINYQMSENHEQGSRPGWQLMDATATTGLTPSGDSASYYDAGAVFTFTGGTTYDLPDIGIFISSTSVIRCVVDWGEIPKLDASNIDITFPGTALHLIGGGNDVTLSESDISISNLQIQDDRFVTFYITDTTNTPFTVDSYTHRFRTLGSGFALTLS